MQTYKQNSTTYYSNLSTKEQQKAMKWLARQNAKTIVFAIEKKEEYATEFSKFGREDQSVIEAAALYCAAHEIMTMAATSTQTKNRSKALNDVKDPTQIQALQFKKNVQSIKYDRLLNMRNKILALKDEHMLSFRLISAFLLKYHRFSVSHTYISTFYRNMKKEEL